MSGRIFGAASVLGEFYGKLLRELAEQGDAAVVVGADAVVCERVMLVGRAVNERLPKEVKELFLLAPEFADESVISRIKASAAKVHLLLGEIDEDGRIDFWEEIGEAERWEINWLSGVGIRVDWAWEEITELLGEYEGEALFEATLLSSEEPIHFFEGVGKTDLMVYWKFKSKTMELSRIRVRELGKPIIIGPDGREIKVEPCPVDLFRRFEISDYPVIYPNQTLFFPFSIRILKRKDFGDWIIFGNSANWGDGYMFSPTLKGEYKVCMKYSSKKDDPENVTSKLEENAVGNSGFGISNYWEGKFISNEITIQIR